VQGVQAHPQKYWFVKNPGKISKNLGKIPENPGKIPENPGKIPENLGKVPENPAKWHPALFDFKKLRTTFAEKHMKTIFLEVTPEKVVMIFVGKNV